LWRVALLFVVSLPSARCQVPEFFGIYANVDGKLASLIGGKGTFAPTQSNLQIYDFLKMSAETENVLVFQGRDMRFLVFDAAVADTSARLEVYKLPYARNLITRPDALAQVGGLLDQVSGRVKPGSQPPSTASPLGKYVVAKTDSLKVELLQKPVPGQPQMIQLVPASDLEAGIYCVFAVRSQGGQQVLVGQLFEWKGQAGSAATPYCIDLAVTGGFGGLINASDARMARPYQLNKEQYVTCTRSDTSLGPGTSSASSTLVAPQTVNNCDSYPTCMKAADAAVNLSNWKAALEYSQAAALRQPESSRPWTNIGRAYLALGRSDEVPSAWDKVLQFGQPLGVDACHERALKPCERGILWLSPTEISFTVSADGQKLFASRPSELAVKTRRNNISISFETNGKKFIIDFIPVGIECALYGPSSGGYLQCPPEALPQEETVADYVSRTIPKLTSGSFVQP
jgi:tetratricopeptide (TPR) repeat protein